MKYANKTGPGASPIILSSLSKHAIPWRLCDRLKAWEDDESFSSVSDSGHRLWFQVDTGYERERNINTFYVLM